MPKNSQKVSLINKSGILLILTGTVVWSLTMVKSGLVYSYGMGFWGPNGHDGVWHISLANTLSKGSFEMPIFAGEAIKNYHIGFDMFLALLNKVTTIPISTLYFQILPPLTGLLIGILTYSFVYRWKKSERSAFWSTFFVYFAGNVGWVVTLLRSGELGGESMFWAQPAVLTLLNPPFSFSLVLILVGLNLLINYRSHTTYYILLATVFGLLIQIKAYSGIIILGALFVTGIYQYLRTRELSFIKIFLITATLSFIIFFQNLSSGSLLELKPFWFLETMMSFPDRLSWPKFGEAMINYKFGSNFFKAVLAYTFAFLLFWFGNIGTRFVSKFYIIHFLRNKKWPGSLDIFILSAIFIGGFFSMLFVQRGTAWNTIQFFYYSLFLVSIISGIVFAQIIEFTKYKTQKIFLSLAVVIFTIPTTIGVLKHYLPSRPPSKISHEELSALKFLAEQDPGTVLVMPFDREAANAAIDNPPRPLYLYESTAYVSAFSGQKVWLEDEVNLDITGYEWQKRRNELLQVFRSNDLEEMTNFLSENNISYVYVPKDIENSQFSSLKQLYSNSEVLILGHQ